ncbi:MAG: metallophosphoesterase family protein [bacterium]
MRRAVLSDVHGNLHALTATFNSIDQHSPDQIVCLGDIVGYGAHPSECIALVRQRCEIILAGNHDWGVCGRQSLQWFNPYAREAALWTREKLGSEEIQWLDGLPLTCRDGELFFVHASPLEPENWEYIDSQYSAERALEGVDARMVFIGHSHRAEIYRVHDRVLVNVGSVGQPRDGNPRARWCLVDDETMQPKLIGVDYNIPGAMNAIRAAGLPEMLALRLEAGR